MEGLQYPDFKILFFETRLPCRFKEEEGGATAAEIITVGPQDQIRHHPSDIIHPKSSPPSKILFHHIASANNNLYFAHSSPITQPDVLSATVAADQFPGI